MANPKAASPPATNGSSHTKTLDPGGKPLEAKNGKHGVNGGSKGEENGGHLPNGSCKNLGINDSPVNGTKPVEDANNEEAQLLDLGKKQVGGSHEDAECNGSE